MISFAFMGYLQNPQMQSGTLRWTGVDLAACRRTLTIIQTCTGTWSHLHARVFLTCVGMDANTPIFWSYALRCPLRH